eukprot:TRINITY_DN47463_c0_g2_i1.p1 TRINITY_DN47463_c0_g2~~TRINITY_DN47463_c0_g2_i1.p1  ORF type:complete len:856 (-),score=179.08 TRINITY_DN47463_c0_g2_i1:75-2642(-)
MGELPGFSREIRLAASGERAERGRNGADADRLSSAGEDYLAQNPSVIQFSAAIYYCSEAEESEMSIDVIRLGDASRTATVRYKSVDGSARAGVKYEAVGAELVFKPGEVTKTLAVPIIGSDSWDATLEFGVLLSDCKGARLGKYLNQCRVTIIDVDIFPSNHYATTFTGGLKVPAGLEPRGESLFNEFVGLMLSDSVTYCKFLQHLVIDSLKGFYYFCTIYLQVYLIDVVLAKEEDEESAPVSGMPERRLMGAVHGAVQLGTHCLARLLGEASEDGEKGGGGGEEEGVGFMVHTLIVPHERRRTAMAVAALYVAPFLLVHIMDLSKAYIALAPRIRRILQANLLRKFLYYDEVQRTAIEPEEITLGMMRDIVEVVDFGFMKLVAVIGIIVKLMFALAFILAENRLAAIPLIVCPVLLGGFLRCREKLNVHVMKEKAHHQDAVMRFCNATIRSYRLIADFFMRPRQVSDYEDVIDEFHAREEEANFVFANNLYAAPWLTQLIIGGYMVIGSSIVKSVEGGFLDIGVFVATINIFKEIGAEIKEIYTEFVEIQKSFEPLTTVAIYMNFKTDLGNRRTINRMRRKRGEKDRLSMRKATASLDPTQFGKTTVAFPVDLTQIAIENVTFSYGLEPPVLYRVKCEFEQGKIHAFVGHSHGGKATVLKLLGGVYLPWDERHGRVFVPSHLRILHVGQDDVLLNGSFLHNIVLNSTMDRVGGVGRVIDICRLLNFEPELIEELRAPQPEEGEDVNTRWTQRVSNTSFARLHLARALVMNPEVLVLHKPLARFNLPEMQKVLGVIRRHVDDKGLLLCDVEKVFRRPRTVFISLAAQRGTDSRIDRVYKVEDGKVVPQDQPDRPL